VRVPQPSPSSSRFGVVMEIFGLSRDGLSTSLVNIIQNK
jgi:hypothetical protein